MFTNNSANGLAVIDGGGITIHNGDNLPGSSFGRSLVAMLAAHEIAHNLGLSHVNDDANLLDDGTELYDSQIATARASEFSQVM